MTQEKIPVDKLVRVYLKIREAKAALRKQYEADELALEEQRKEIANALKQTLQDAGGVNSLRTDYGTVIMQTKVRYWTQDWDAFKKFVIEHDALDLFEKRIAQKNMDTFLKDNPGVVPHGLNADSEVEVTVRKSTN